MVIKKEISVKKLIFASLILCGLNVVALEAGEFAQKGTVLNHLQADGTESNQDLLAMAKEHKLVMLEFFQTTCGACTENRPQFIALSKEFAQTTTFKYVGLDRKEKVLREFYEAIKAEFSFPYVLDNNRLGQLAFTVRATPTSFIVDENGKVLFKHEGTFESSDLQIIREILK
jgi:thiol-disulfide isomerase/thioredoxin